MANKVPLLTGSASQVEDAQPHYVLVFPNPFDTKNSKLHDKQSARKASKNLARAFKLKLSELADPDNDPIRGYLTSVPWFSTDHSENDHITKQEFITGMLSAILNFIHHYIELDYTLFQSRDRDELICRIFSKENWLRDVAEEEQYKLQFASKTTHPAKFNFKSVSPYAPFETTRKGAVFNSETFYKHYDVNDEEVDARSTSGSYQSLFTYNDKVRLVFNWISNTLDLNSLQHSGILIQHFCVHNEKKLSELSTNWATFKALFKAQPLNSIRLYFGEKVAFYFSWMSMYMHAMIIAAVVGVITFFTMRFTSENPQVTEGAHKETEGAAQEIEYSVPQILTVVFALFMAMWGSGFDQAWTRREKELAWRWGTINYYEEEEQRGPFKGEFGYDEISGKNKKLRTDSLMYKLRKTTSYCVAGLFVGTVIAAVTAIFLYRASLRINKVPNGNLICAMINAVQIRVMNIIYGKVAIWMTNWENHETETQYNDNLAVKLFLFKFVNSYSSLFYLAFVQPYAEGCPVESSCMHLLTVQLTTIFMTNLSLNLVELGLPFLKHYLKLRSENKNIEHLRKEDETIRVNMGPVESQSKLEGYESPLDDYMEMAIQYGYVSMFCASFQLLPLLALIELVLEIKVDSIKLCKLTKRPFPHRAEDIGVWKTILQTIAFFSTLTNPAIIMFTSNTFVHMDHSTRLLIFLAIEHLLFLLRYLIEVMVPDTPSGKI